MTETEEEKLKKISESVYVSDVGGDGMFSIEFHGITVIKKRGTTEIERWK